MKKIYNIVLLLFVVGFVGYAIYRHHADEREMEQHSKSTICKFTLCKAGRRSSTAYVKYFVDGKVYRNTAGGCPDDPSDKLDKFFELRYSALNPNKIRVDFSQEVNDSVRIKELESKLTFQYWLDH